MPEPLLSIGLPVYNGERYLRQAIDSILSQDFTDFELIISDNASTDDTARICSEYAMRDARIRYIRIDRNIGVNPNHDRVFHLSRGHYFNWMAHDVELLPGMLSRCLAEMDRSPSPPALVFPQCEIVEDGHVVPPIPSDSIASRDQRPHRRLRVVVEHLSRVNQLYGMMKREVLARTRLNGSYPSSDYVLLAELAMLGELREIPEVLIRRRVDTDRGTAAVFRDMRKWQQWLDPNSPKRSFIRLCIRERLALEYFRSAWRLPLPWRDKVPCLVAGPTAHYGRILRGIAGTWRRRFGRLIPKKSPGIDASTIA